MTSPPPSYQTTTIRPNGTVQAPSGGTTLVGAANAHTAWSDNTDASYVQFTTRCRIDSAKVKVSFPAPSIPAGAQIFSVGVQVRIQSVIAPAPQPVHVGWHHCTQSQNIISTILQGIFELLFGWTAPSNPTTATWVLQDLPTETTDPQGNPWTVGSFNNYQQQIGRDDLNGNASRISELYVNITYSVQSSITVTAPTGSVTTTARPTLTWTYANSQNDAQQAYQWAVYTTAQAAIGGFTPFVSPSSDSSGGYVFSEILQATTNVDLINGGYVGYVQVQQAWAGLGTFTSAPASTSWTQAVAAPPPAATLTDAFWDVTNNRVQLDFLPSSSSPVTTLFAVYVSRDLGATWGFVRNYMSVAASGMSTITAYDYEAPPNIPSQYKVLSYASSAPAVPATSFSATLSATPTRIGFWLIDPLNPLNNTMLPVAYLGDQVTIQKSQGTFLPLAGTTKVNAIVVQGVTYGRQGTFQLIYKAQDGAAIYTAFRQADESTHVLLLQYPTGEQHYMVFGPGSVGSDTSYTWDLNPALNGVKYRKMSVSYVKVDMPAVTS